MADHSNPCAGCEQSSETRVSVQDKAIRESRSKPPLRVVFMGTPDFAAVILERLLDSPVASVVAAYSQPDRPAGRGKQMRSPAVKQLAERRGIPVQQPLNFKNTPEGLEAVESLSAYGPDLLVVAAYGLILPQRVLDVPSLMPVNVHASLLPKYRGAAPIQRAIINGETVTGVTIMRMEAGLDTGPILMQRAVGIGLQDTSATLHDELAREGGDLLVAALERLSAGALQSVPQDGGRATYAQKLTKSESALDFRESARALHARIRGLTPWPGAVMKLCRPGQEDILVQLEPGIFPAPAGLKECAAGLVSSASAARPGSVLGVYENALLLSCGDGTYAISSLRPAGKKTMDGRAFFNGYLAGAPEACFIGPEE